MFVLALIFFSQFEEIGGIEDPQGREQMLDALQLRFSLIGGMFDTVQKNSSLTTDWAILLTQLVCQGVIDLTTNRYSIVENCVSLKSSI